MPIIIALDVSLSMSRPISVSNCVSVSSDVGKDELPTRKKLAVEAINQFLDHISSDCKLDFVSLLTFSSQHRIEVDFLREVDNIRAALFSIEEFDKSNYESMLQGINALAAKTWSSTVSVDIILITDGSPGFGPGSLRDVIDNAKPFPFPAKMNILSLSDPNEKNFTENCPLLQRLIHMTAGEGLVYLPENHLNSKGCSSAVAKLCAKDFVQYKGLLRCGNLSSKITLSPAPRPFVSRAEDKRYDVANTLEIIGFIELNDLASPSANSRHLLFPLKPSDVPGATKTEQPPVDDDLDGNIPNFCVLLHGALKVENFCAICEVGPRWYGFIYSWADNKKKSNLMLSILPPGTDMIPWLGKMHQLGPKEEFLSYLLPGSSLPNGLPSFPVKPNERRSYVANPTVWLAGEEGLCSDIQKLMRHAKKMPDKTSHFYKELNRMRRWALTLGFGEVLESLALILERECMSTPGLHADTAIQLTHAAQQLRSVRGYNRQLIPHTRHIGHSR